MPTWIFKKRAGAPAGTISIDLQSTGTSPDFTISDAVGSQITTTDAAVAYELLREPYLRLDGIETDPYVPQPVVKRVFTSNGDLVEVGNDGSATTIPVVNRAQVERTAASFGVAADARRLSGLTVSGAVVSASPGTFAASDVGKTVCLYGANGSGIAHQDVVASRESSSQVTLASAVPSASVAAISKVQEATLSSGGDGSATTFTVTLTGVTPGNSLILNAVVGSPTNSDIPVISVADNVGGAWHRVVGQRVAIGTGGGTDHALWQCVESPGGSVAVTVTTNGSAPASTAVSLYLMEWSGIGGYDARQLAAAQSSGTAATATVSPQLAGSLVLAAELNGTRSANPSAPWTNLTGAQWFNSASAPVSYQIVAGADTPTSAAWTLSSSAVWGVLVAAFRPKAPITSGVIGTDDTEAWQAAIDWATPIKGGARITGEGISLIAGPQVSGSVTSVSPAGHTYPYSGQLLLPAKALNSGDPTWQFGIEGSVPVPAAIQAQKNWSNPPVPGGLTLLSTASSGYLLSVIPSDTGSFVGAFSWVSLHARRVSFTTVFDASGDGPGALDLEAAASMNLDEVNVSVENLPAMYHSFPPTTGADSTAGVGVVCPGDNNWGHIVWNGGNLNGYPKGVMHGEHAVFRSVLIDNVGAALCPGGYGVDRPAGAHGSHYDWVLVQACGRAFLPTSRRGGFGATVTGRIEIEMPADCLINDQGRYLAGRVQVGGTSRGDLGVRTHGESLFFENAWFPRPMPAGNVAVGDTLKRAGAQNAMAQPTPFGLADKTAHVWSPNKGALVDSNGAFGAATYGAWRATIRNTPAWRSRKVSATVTTSTTANRAYAGIQIRSDLTPLAVILDGTAGQQVLIKSGSSLQTTVASASLAIAAGTAYSVDVHIRQSAAPGARATITVFVGGAQVLTHTLTAAETSTTFPYTGVDGVCGYTGSTSDDGKSRVSDFSITQLTDRNCLYSGTTALVAGTKAVADTSITANSRVKVWNDSQAGTPGALSVTKTAGTGFTINSTSGSDTSTVYYEVESY